MKTSKESSVAEPELARECVGGAGRQRGEGSGHRSVEAGGHSGRTWACSWRGGVT